MRMGRRKAMKAIAGISAMGAMPYMESRGQVSERGAGVYVSRYGLAMGGEWDARIAVTGRAGAAEAAYRLSTSVKGVAFDTLLIQDI